MHNATAHWNPGAGIVLAGAFLFPLRKGEGRMSQGRAMQKQHSALPKAATGYIYLPA